MLIVYVDDDAEDIEIFREALKAIDTSITCHVAENGKKAMNVLNADFVPDFIFLDVNMPVINGKSVLTEVRRKEKFNNTPVVMCSTTMNSSEMNEYKALGADHFFIKHNHFQDLCDSLSKILNPG